MATFFCRGLGLLSIASLAFGSDPSRLWDVVMGRRPYIAEKEGHLLLSTPGFEGRSLQIAASLPCASRQWSWNATGGKDKILSLGSLMDMPRFLNNDLIVNLTVGNSTFSKRRRFMRAFKETATNTVQVDHSTAGLLVDGKPWVGVGWYMYLYLDFAGRNCSVRSPGFRERRRECMLWGVQNQTDQLARWAEHGVNLVMAYGMSPYEHGYHVPSELVLKFFDEAAKHQVKVLFPMASWDLDSSAFTNLSLWRVNQSVMLVKDHPALLGYYICDDCHTEPHMAQVYNSIKILDPFHITVGASFGGSGAANFGDSGISSRQGLAPSSEDTWSQLPGLKENGKMRPCAPRTLKRGLCKEVTAPQPYLSLSLDLQLVENYSPSPGSLSKQDAGLLRRIGLREPVVNCPGSYTMEECSI
eukprot:TRINITY_DN7972_c1_g1_i2.p1 TRINITY_DN7972_c1_g1~~TRINITY_DN7972_c1_g1_i2.p1  ORF type:complete len:421 (+),score=55.15 TRINITY_DN7972_c1_g1_i2:24-1265(+)